MHAVGKNEAVRTYETTDIDVASAELLEAAKDRVCKQTMIGVDIGEDFDDACLR